MEYFMITYNTIAELSSAKLIVGDLVQILGEDSVGDRGLMTGIVRPKGHLSFNRLVSISDGLFVEIFPEPSESELRLDLSSDRGTGLIGVNNSAPNLNEYIKASDTVGSFGYSTKALSERLSRVGAKVVLVGDSLSSFFNIDTTNISSIFESYLRSGLLEFNDTIQFYNRAIGGKRYYDLGRSEPAMSAPSSSYPWYSDTTKRWMDYIDEIKPDVVIIAFGMNDGTGWNKGNFQPDNFLSMMEELSGISSSPELVFCTNILPSTVNPSSSSEEEQMGRDAMAGWTRSYAETQGYSVIDLHRQFKGLRDGVDPCYSSYARRTIKKQVTLPFSFEEKCSMYSVRLTVDSPSVIHSGVSFQLSEYTNNFLNLKYNTTSNMWEVLYYIGTSSSLGIIDKVIAKGKAPAKDDEIYFTMNGNTVTIMVGVNTAPIFSANVIRFGGDFIPQIGGSGDIFVDLMKGTLLPVKPSLSDYDIYNSDGDGGNALNHPTAKASSIIYTRPVDCFVKSLTRADLSFTVDLDFVKGVLSVNNPYNPELTKTHSISDVLVFSTGGLNYKRDSLGNIQGAIFGTTNQATIDPDLFIKYDGPYKKFKSQVDLICPTEQAYPVVFGEGAAHPRFVAQVSSDLRPRGTIVSGGNSADLIGPGSFPYVPGKKYSMEFLLDCEEGTVKLKSYPGTTRLNNNTTNITSLEKNVLSKMKLGYLSSGAVGADVVVSRIRINFSN